MAQTVDHVVNQKKKPISMLTKETRDGVNKAVSSLGDTRVLEDSSWD